MPSNLRSLFAKPVDRHIEGVIKADDESDLFNEVSEYVVTSEIAEHIDDLLTAYLSTDKENGVWISGFFGSGKSHLLKILSLLLENRTLAGTPAAELFIPKIADDTLLKADLEKAVRIPSCSVRFNIDQKADLIAKNQTDALLSVFVKVFNELRGYYPKQGYIAEIESDLDGRGMFQAFRKAYSAEAKGRSWEEDRDIVHTLENETFARAYAQVTGMAYEEAVQTLDRKQASYKVAKTTLHTSQSAFPAMPAKKKCDLAKPATVTRGLPISSPSHQPLSTLNLERKMGTTEYTENTEIIEAFGKAPVHPEGDAGLPQKPLYIQCIPCFPWSSSLNLG